MGRGFFKPHPPMPGYVWRKVAHKKGFFSLFDGMIGGDPEDNPDDAIEDVVQSWGYNFYETGFGTNRWHITRTDRPLHYEFSEFAKQDLDRSWRNDKTGYTPDDVIQFMKKHHFDARGLRKKLMRRSREGLRHRVVSATRKLRTV